MNNPKVTVLMSVYNGERFLDESVESILNQSFTDFEFLIINDGSTDSSQSILDNYVKQDPRIKLINQDNIGLSESLQKGISNSRGELIARQDAGDLSAYERLEKQVNAFEFNNELGLIGSYAAVVTSENKEVGLIEYPTDNLKIQEKLIDYNCFCHGSVMFKKNCLKDTGSIRPEFKYSQDYDLWLRIAEKYDVTNLAQPLYKLRFLASSLTFANRYEQYKYSQFAKNLAIKRRNETDNVIKSNNEIDDLRAFANEEFQENKKSLREKRDLSNDYLYWGDILLKGGEIKSSRKLLFEAVSSNPFNFRAWSSLFHSYL